MNSAPFVLRLDWDSNFFGFDTGRLFGNLDSETLVRCTLNDAFNSGFRLVYGECAHNDFALNAVSASMGGNLLDIKRTYELGVSLKEPLEVNVEELGECCPIRESQLMSLALQAGQFSRFKNDPLLPAGSWEKMYWIWMEKCISGELADKVFIRRDGNIIVGMLTLKFNEMQGQIGLFSVDRAWRGRGIGKALLAAAIQKSATAGCKKIKVVTQGQNMAACTAYKRAGFYLVNEQDVFHFWAKAA